MKILTLPINPKVKDILARDRIIESFTIGDFIKYRETGYMKFLLEKIQDHPKINDIPLVLRLGVYSKFIIGHYDSLLKKDPGLKFKILHPSDKAALPETFLINSVLGSIIEITKYILNNNTNVSYDDFITEKREKIINDIIK